MIEAILAAVLVAATPLLLAAIGELVAERAGVINLGVEGTMALGAVCAFAASAATGSPWLGLLAGAAAGVAMSALFALTAVWFATNQVATGLAFTLTGLGLAGLIGEGFVGQPGVRLPTLELGEDLPFGAVLSQDPLFYASLAITAGVGWFLFRTRAGLKLRAVGDRPEAAHALGLSVNGTRTLAVLFGGLMAGLAGAHLTLVYTPQWVDNVTAGRGFIALALVVFASWRPGRVVVGAYLFGAVTIAQFHAQAIGVAVPSQLLSALPYLATVVVLVLISLDRRFTMINTPAALGQPFVPER